MSAIPADVPIARVAVRPAEAAAMLGMGRTMLYELLESGELPSFKVGRRRLVPVAAVHKFVERNQQSAAHPAIV